VALGFDPIHRQAQAAVVKLLAESGNLARSDLSAEIYMNQAGTSASASLRLGQAFQRELMDDYAVACYQQALSLAPNSAAIHRQIGYYYLSKADKVRAEEYLRRSFQIDPYQAEVAGVLGRMGVVVQVPRKTEKNTKKLDKILDQ
jgi:tetratricopeptide (TPR) repeat protein